MAAPPLAGQMACGVRFAAQAGCGDEGAPARCAHVAGGADETTGDARLAAAGGSAGGGRPLGGRATAAARVAPYCGQLLHMAARYQRRVPI